MEDERALYASINDTVPRKPRLRGSQYLDQAEQQFAQAAQTVQGWAEDKEGIGDDITRLGLGGLKNIGKAASLPGVSHALRIAGAPAWAAGKALGAGLEHGLGVDPRYGQIVGEVGEWFIPGYGLAKGAKNLAKASKLGNRLGAVRGARKFTDTAADIAAQQKGSEQIARAFRQDPTQRAALEGLQMRLGQVDDVGMNPAFSQQLDDLAGDPRVSPFTPNRVERARFTTEDIARQNLINEANLNAWRRSEAGKSTNTYDRIRRGHQGTPTKQTELRAKEWAKNHSDPRIRERLVKMDAYEARITPANYAKNLYPQWLTQPNVKGGNRKITQLEGLEYTVEQHHLIHLRDSATIGKYLDDLDSPITKAAVYEYMMKKYNILPGNFDLNIANIPTGPHRMTQGGDLHTWLDRLGYDDYWGDVAAEWKRIDKTPTYTDILDAFDVYMDEVFNPMMVKLDDLVKKNPTKGEFKGAYVPEYLVEQAKNRLRHLQEPHSPQRLRGGQGGAEEALEAQMEQVYKGGEGVRDTRYQEPIDGLALDSRKHHSGGPDQPKRKKKELEKLKKKDRMKGL